MTAGLNIQELFGGIDIYLFDQLLKGRLPLSARVLDAGCGSGRNLVYFLRSGYHVFGVDESEMAIQDVKALAKRLAPQIPSNNFQVSSVEALPFANLQFDFVVSSAVLHFARNETHWRDMVQEMWRVLKPGGIFFARLASSIGIEQEISLITERRYLLPDGSERFLTDEEMLLDTTRALAGRFVEPIKTVVVHHMRAMTTWVIEK